MMPLTKKQKQLLDYLSECDTAPSFDEMRDALGLRSKSGVHRLISALEERGFINRVPNRARAIEINNSPSLRSSLSSFSKAELAAEAQRRGLVLGNIYRDAYGQRKFEAISA